MKICGFVCVSVEMKSWKTTLGEKKILFFQKKKKKKKGTLPLVLFSYCFENLKKVNQ